MIFFWRKIVVKLLQENLLLENESVIGYVDKNKFSFEVRTWVGFKCCIKKCETMPGKNKTKTRAFFYGISPIQNKILEKNVML